MIIVGLGNPGQEYEQTRHNLGFTVVEKLAERLEASPWKSEFGVRWSKAGQHWLIEPLEYMNASGPTLKSFLKKKNVEINIESELLVVHDDVDFSLGEFHQQFDRSAAGHNGVQSIIEIFGKKFGRIRIGIGSNKDMNVPAEDYVLQKFSAAEKKVIDHAADRVVAALAEKFSA